MVRSALSKAGPFIAAMATGAAILLFALAGLYTYRQQNYVDEKLCRSAVENRMATRGSWLALQTLALQNIRESSDSEAEKQEAVERTHAFVQAVLRPIPALECVDNQPVPKEGP